MIGFYDNFLGDMMPLSRIKSISQETKDAKGVTFQLIRMDDGTATRAYGGDVGGLMLRPVQLIPAERGTHIIRVDGSNPEDSGPWREPVIAWALCLDGEVRPVSPNGVCGGSEGPTYVEMPGGTVQAVTQWLESLSFESADAMLAHFRAKGTYSGRRG